MKMVTHKTDQHSSHMPSQKEIVEELCRLVGLKSDQAGGQVNINGSDPVTPSPHRLGDISAAALATLGIAIGGLWRQRTGETQDVQVEIDEAVQQLSAVYLSKIRDQNVFGLLDDPGCWDTNDFYRTKTGRFVFIVNSLPRLRDIACAVLNCPPNHSAYVECIKNWDPFELEEAIATHGGCCVAVRTADEWAAHPQGKALASQPVIRLEKIGDSAPVAFHSSPENAFSGIRVLDNTHIIAGPISGRIMAEYGAQVLHISRPAYADPTALLIETGLGKHNAHCNLDNDADLQRLRQLLSTADVWVNSYLDMQRLGLSSKQLIEKYPGIIAMDFSCYGDTGPWANRGGFDQMGQAATGFSVEEGGFDHPKLPPTHLVNDYLAAVLGVIGITAALQRRAIEGGSWQIHINLAQVCSWVRSQGLFTEHALQEAIIPKLTPPRVQTIPTAFGPLTYLPTQFKLSILKPKFSCGSTPWGSAPLCWPHALVKN